MPLVHSMHTMAKVKNHALADGDSPEPPGREIGEAQVVEAADRLVANTDDEAKPAGRPVRRRPEQGRRRATRRRPRRVPPDRPACGAGGRAASRPTRCCCCSSAGSSRSRRRTCCCAPPPTCCASVPTCASRLVVAVVGGPSGIRAARRRSRCSAWRSSSGSPTSCGSRRRSPRTELAGWYGAADLVVVPSYSESFGLVAVEAQACGTPVVAAGVGGLRTAVADGCPACWSTATTRVTGPRSSATCWTTQPAGGGWPRGAIAARRAVRLGRDGRRAARRLPRSARVEYEQVHADE